MPVAKSHFTVCNEKGLEVGQLVSAESSMIGNTVGIIDAIWYGCDEMVDIKRADDTIQTHMASEVIRLE